MLVALYWQEFTRRLSFSVYFYFEILFRGDFVLQVWGNTRFHSVFSVFAVLSSLHIQDLPGTGSTPFSCVCFFITVIKGWSSMLGFLRSNTSLGIPQIFSIHLQSAVRTTSVFHPTLRAQQNLPFRSFPGAQAIVPFRV